MCFGPKAPKADPELERQRAEREKQLADEKAAGEARKAEEDSARARGLRGSGAVFSGSQGGRGFMSGGNSLFDKLGG